MRIFGIGKRRGRRAKRQPTAEQMAKNAEMKRRRFVAESYIAMAHDDPEWKHQMIAQEYNLRIPEKDPAVEQRRQLDELISSLAMEKIKENPELASRIVDARITQLMSEEGFMARGEDEEHYPGTALRQVLEEIEDLEELKSRLGAGKGAAWADLFKDQQFFTNLLPFLQAIISGGLPQILEPTVTALIDGQPRMVTKSEYERLKREGRVKPIAVVASPKAGKEPDVGENISELTDQDESTEPIRDGVAEEPGSSESDETQLPLIFNLVDLTELASYLEQAPADAVAQLEAKTLEGIPYAQILWAYLKKADYESLIQEVVAYKGHSKVALYAEKLLSNEGRAWLSEVMELIKHRANHNISAI